MKETRILLQGGHYIDVMMTMAEIGQAVNTAKTQNKDVVMASVHYKENRKAKAAIPVSSIVALIQIVDEA